MAQQLLSLLVDTSIFMWWCFLEKLLRLLGPSFVLDLWLQPVEGDAVSQITTWTNWISLCDFPSIPGCFIKLSSLVSSSILLLVLTHHPPSFSPLHLHSSPVYRITHLISPALHHPLSLSISSIYPFPWCFISATEAFSLSSHQAVTHLCVS